jgi:uncharacterized protein
MTTVLITGGTGLVGKALGQALLQKGYRVIILSRGNKPAAPGASLQYANWNVDAQTIDENAVKQADYIIHLAGAGVAEKRWTAKRKKEIEDSRVKSCQLIVNTLSRVTHQVKAVISASAIGWYGPDPQIPNTKPFQEDAAAAPDFLGTVCEAWEKSIEPVQQSGVRLVKYRIGIVLSREGGALKELQRPLRFGVAATLGKGNQVMSWIHIQDMVQLFIYGMENPELKGSYNAVAPHPVNNREFTKTLAKSRLKFYIPVRVPSFVLRWMLGEMSIEVLKSATVSAEKIQRTGFVFQYPKLEEALQHL